MRWRSGTPEEAARAVTLAPGERILAAAQTPDGAWVVGTDRRLHLPSGAGASGEGHVVVAWDHIDAATWHKDDSRLVVVTLPIGGQQPARYEVVLPQPGHLPELVRERVTSTILVSQHVPLVGRSGARIFGRRAPGSAEIVWTVVYDKGVDGNDPAIDDRLQDEFERLRADLGV